MALFLIYGRNPFDATQKNMKALNKKGFRVKTLAEAKAYSSVDEAQDVITSHGKRGMSFEIRKVPKSKEDLYKVA